MSWISTKDRMPAVNQAVLVCSYDHGEINMHVADFSGHWNIHNEGSDLFFVTHWMPLPEPPYSPETAMAEYEKEWASIYE